MIGTDTNTILSFGHEQDKINMIILMHIWSKRRLA